MGVEHLVLIGHTCCVRVNHEGHYFMCRRRWSVKRERNHYCWQHDPIRIARKLDVLKEGD